MSKTSNALTALLKFVGDWFFQIVVMAVSLPLMYLIFVGVDRLPLWVQESLSWLSLAALGLLAFAVFKGFSQLIKRDING